MASVIVQVGEKITATMVAEHAANDEFIAVAREDGLWKLRRIAKEHKSPVIILAGNVAETVNCDDNQTALDMMREGLAVILIMKKKTGRPFLSNLEIYAVETNGVYPLGRYERIHDHSVWDVIQESVFKLLANLEVATT